MFADLVRCVCARADRRNLEIFVNERMKIVEENQDVRDIERLMGGIIVEEVSTRVGAGEQRTTTSHRAPATPVHSDSKKAARLFATVRGEKKLGWCVPQVGACQLTGVARSETGADHCFPARLPFKGNAGGAHEARAAEKS